MNLAYIPSPTFSKFEIGPFTIHMYAICILIGICVAVWILATRWKRYGGTFDQILDTTLVTVPCALVGARLYHCITTPADYFPPTGNLVNILKVWEGGMAIFGSYIGKDHSLVGESLHVIFLDTFVAVLAGIIIFPACFTYDLEVTAGPSLLFDTMASVFTHIPGGRWWGALFFLFMVFAALSTVLGVCENILAMIRELTGWSRPKGCAICGVGIFALALTTALGYSVLHFQPFAPGTAWLDFWDFVVSNNVLPLGSLVLALFCCNRFGWGWDNFVAEANTGKGLKVRPWMKPIFRYFVPAAILFIYLYGMFTFTWR